MAEISMPQLQVLIADGRILWTEHVAIRLRGRGIKRADVIKCIETGEIIEQYADDVPFPSCLVSGKCRDGKPLHIVIGLKVSEVCCMITAYRPDTDKWEGDFKTRKKGEKNNGLFSL